jgi:hypothetical protein
MMENFSIVIPGEDRSHRERSEGREPRGLGAVLVALDSLPSHHMRRMRCSPGMTVMGGD